MRYICENGHIFEHTGKMITTTEFESNEDGNLAQVTYETPCCPICKTLIYSEYTLDKKTITSLISVDISEVDAKLKEGYEIQDTYAKTATLVKKEK